MKLLKPLKGNLKKLASMMLPDCKAVAVLQSELLNRNPPLAQRLRVRLHPLFCKWCRRYSRQLVRLRDVAGRGQPEARDTPPSLSAQAKERIKRSCTSPFDRRWRVHFQIDGGQIASPICIILEFKIVM
jgi:hypothetical protein